MFHARRLLPKQRIINNRNLQRINPLNECERPIQNHSITNLSTKNRK
jgi:hypothetical protein